MNSKYRNLLWLVPIAILVIAAVPSFQDFNINQFSGSGNKVAIKSGVTLTNVNIRDELELNGGDGWLFTSDNPSEPFLARWTNSVTGVYFTIFDGAQAVTNNYYFPTNMYQAHDCVFTYFIVNVLSNDVTVSNFFQTNFLSYPNPSNFFATNIYYQDAYVSNYFVTNVLNDPCVSNTFLTNIFQTDQYITTNYSPTIILGSGVFTNGITNLALTADTVLKADENKGIVSIQNAAGVLSNSGNGTFTWVPMASGIAGADVLTMINTNAVWTNDGTWTWLSSYPSVDPNYGAVNPPFFIQNATGSKFWGSNVTYSADPTDTDTVQQYALFFSGSNEPSAMNLMWEVIDNENYGKEAQVQLSADISLEPARANLWLNTFNGSFGRSFEILMRTNSSYQRYRSNGITVWQMDEAGLQTAAGFKDSSLTPGSIVGVGASGRLINTNIDLSAYQIGSLRLTNVANLADEPGVLTNDGSGGLYWVGINTLINTNVTIQNIRSVKTYITELYLTGGQVTNGIVMQEHTWKGPTNELYVGSTNRYLYVASTPCSITNLVSWVAEYGNSALLQISNAASTNITITIEGSIRLPYGGVGSTYTLTNGDVWAGSFDKGTFGSLYVPRGFFAP